MNQCGVSKNYVEHKNQYDRHQKRIVGGVTSLKHEWPWLVSLMMNKKNHICGGTLIKPQWVLSAAHCFEPIWSELLSDNAKNWTARIGEHNLFKEQENHVDIELEKIIIPNGRDVPNRLNVDIALLKLSRPVSFDAENINIVCLPNDEQIINRKKECVTAGWGYQTEGGQLSATVKHIHIPIVDTNACAKMYENISIFFKFYDDMMCAMATNKDACQFDSGGPFICYNYLLHHWELTGIISTGMGCARPNFPGIYTKVIHYTKWINETIEINS
ncbi:hypothetical protein A3Q56_04366 [Intoshia linei]|uniref:Peptidase S1 domain-containing protein n=1 Tax=Intoshia linei TaxID=1819745 RepID=A0A177B0S8_9BILA|nr:hypothetical protein A3Q56_04366 [Intoshia linei]